MLRHFRGRQLIGYSCRPLITEDVVVCFLIAMGYCSSWIARYEKKLSEIFPMKKSVKRGIAATCLLTMAMNLTACGYFLYPERKGQAGGRVDPVVVILDGAALLFGILPGIVAFAVDFTNGTIYLPSGGSSAIDRHLTAIDGDQGKPVLDQNGNAWIALPLEAVAGDSKDVDQIAMAVGQFMGAPVAAKDVIWVEDLAALNGAVSQSRATAAR